MPCLLGPLGTPTILLMGASNSTAGIWDRRDEDWDRVQRAAVGSLEMLLPRVVAILERAGCSEIWLVGSFASEDPDESSDVDMIVRGLRATDRGLVVHDLERLLGRAVDLAELERIPPDRLALALYGGRRLRP